MTDGEIIGAVHGALSMLYSNVEIGFYLVAAYLILVYLVGERLTTVQVTIANVTYAFLFIWICAFGHVIHTEMGIYRGMLRDQSPELAASLGIGAGSRVDNFEVFVAIGALAFLVGSLYVMWAVRHPKTE